MPFIVAFLSSLKMLSFMESLSSTSRSVLACLTSSQMRISVSLAGSSTKGGDMLTHLMLTSYHHQEIR